MYNPLPRKDRRQDSILVYRLHSKKVTTQKVKAVCKTFAIKMTSAVHAAIVQAVAVYEQHPLTTHFFITAVIDLQSRHLRKIRGNVPEPEAGFFISLGLVFVEEPVAEVKGLMRQRASSTPLMSLI